MKKIISILIVCLILPVISFADIEAAKSQCKELGFEHVTILKMALAQMPGGNRVDEETGKPRAKNFCKVNGIWLKYEPIFVFRKS